MKKILFLVFSFITLFHFAEAQTPELIVKKGNQGLYLDHTVGAKQGLYAIGRLYNVNPKFIAAYNKIGLNDGLSIGQTIHIPLTDTNFTQKGNKGTPVYYRVGSNESLQKVSSSNNNVGLQLLKDWNNLISESPRSGVKLVIGFLNSAEMPAITLAPPVKKPETQKPKEDKPTAKTNDVAKTVVKDEPKKEEPKPIVKQEPKKEEVKPVVKDEPKKEEAKVVVKEEPKKEEPKTVVKEDPKKEETKPVVIAEEVKPVINDPVSIENGYFKVYFDQQIKTNPVSKNSTATSGIFKTTSGLQEAKYYMLMDGVVPGTIVMVTNPSNNKTIYAKVLGEMSGIRQNQGFDIRISNAAASTLGIQETDKFIVKVNY